MADPWSTHHAAERAKAERAERQAADPNSPGRIKARMDAATKTREPSKPDVGYRMKAKFYEAKL